MRKGFVVLSGTSIRDSREWVPSPTEALRLVHQRLKLRRPGVRVEDERGNPVSFFELKGMAALEDRKENVSRYKVGRRPLTSLLHGPSHESFALPESNLEEIVGGGRR